MSPPDYPAPVLTPPGAAPPAVKSGAIRMASDADLFRRTLRMIAILVAACIVFVGALSVVAVTITSRAVGPKSADRAASDAPTTKPLSI